MNFLSKRFAIAPFLCGLCFVVLAVDVFLRARTAERLHTVVPSYRFATWMSPMQAYTASALSFVFGMYSLASSYRKRRPISKPEDIKIEP